MEKLSKATHFKGTEDGLWTIAQPDEEGAKEVHLYQMDLNLLVKPKCEYVNSSIFQRKKLILIGRGNEIGRGD